MNPLKELASATKKGDGLLLQTASPETMRFRRVASGVSPKGSVPGEVGGGVEAFQPRQLSPQLSPRELTSRAIHRSYGTLRRNERPPVRGQQSEGVPGTSLPVPSSVATPLRGSFGPRKGQGIGFVRYAHSTSILPASILTRPHLPQCASGIPSAWLFTCEGAK